MACGDREQWQERNAPRELRQNLGRTLLHFKCPDLCDNKIALQKNQGVLSPSKWYCSRSTFGVEKKSLGIHCWGRGKPVVKSHHFYLTIGNVAILLGFKKWKSIINMATRVMLLSWQKGRWIATSECQPSGLSKGITFHYLFFYYRLFSPVDQRGHIRPLSTSWNSGL